MGRVLAGAALALAAGPACRSEEKKPVLNEEELRKLVAEGALRPVEGMQGDDAFDKRMEEGPESTDPYEGAARRLADPGAEALAPGSTWSGPDAAVVPPENPYLVFGKRIKVHPDGRITKPYPLRVGTGVKLFELLTTYSGFPMYDPASGPQSTDTVRVEVKEKWDIELYADLRAQAKDIRPAQEIPLADWLVVTAAPELLHEVERFLNIFAAGVPQIEIEAKIVEVRTVDSLDFGVSQVDPSTPIFDFPDGVAIDAFTFNFPTAEAGAALAVGAVQDGTAINALIEALAKYENVSIISRPRIAVREGGLAEIVSLQRLPYLEVAGISPSGDVSAGLKYIDVGVQLHVVPRVVGTDTVALHIDVEASQEIGSSVTFRVQTETGETELTSPIVATRSARTIVYLEPGQAVILGGLITDRTVEQEDKVPVLGDIPILGWLFRSTFKFTEQSNVLFFIRPRILQGSDLHREF